MPLTTPSSSGSPGGSNTHVQYNNAGAFAGNAGFTYNATNNRITISGSTPTTSQPSSTFSQTWNTAGTTYSGNVVDIVPTAHAAGSSAQEWQLSGASSFALVRTLGTGNFAYTGLRMRFGPVGGADTVLVSPCPAFDPKGLMITNEAGTALAGSFRAALIGGDTAFFTNTIAIPNGFYAAARGFDTVGTRIPSDGFYAISSTTSQQGAIDVAFGRNAAGVIEVNTGVAGTFADIRARIVRTNPLTVATLVAAATAGAGARSFVTDANATTFAAIVAGGGANGVPVYSDGTNWRVG